MTPLRIFAADDSGLAAVADPHRALVLEPILILKVMPLERAAR
jgi:hypothetical protein